MTPSERQTALLRLLASIDQQIADAEELAKDGDLPIGERAYAEAQLEFRRRAVERIEMMLGQKEI